MDDADHDGPDHCRIDGSHAFFGFLPFSVCPSLCTKADAEEHMDDDADHDGPDHCRIYRVHVGHTCFFVSPPLCLSCSLSVSFFVDHLLSNSLDYPLVFVDLFPHVQSRVSPRSTQLRRPMTMLSMLIWKMLRRIILKLGPRNLSNAINRAMKIGRTRETNGVMPRGGRIRVMMQLARLLILRGMPPGRIMILMCGRRIPNPSILIGTRHGPLPRLLTHQPQQMPRPYGLKGIMGLRA